MTESGGADPGRVALGPAGLAFAGERRLWFGGEVQYYRVRDLRGDPARTHARWAQTLDAMVQAEMSLVTTYVPWDYHELAPGSFRWDGVADLERFFALCAERGLRVIAKPGPFINSEWPTGLGSFGAVPAWFKQAHPEALALRPDGKPFSSDLLRRARGVQPSRHAPAFLAATRAWFTALAPRLLPWIERGVVVGVQIDNETNDFFGDRYAVDYHPLALSAYRRWLREHYHELDLLNRAYGTDYTTFDAVEPPTSRPGRREPPQVNLRHQDWFAAGQAAIGVYQRQLRTCWEALGIREPDVLFVTNDSPHTFPGLNLSQWHGPTKNLAGLATLDAYPKQFPLNARPLDYPFLTAYFSQRFAASNDAHHRFAGGEPVAAGHCYGMELEGGLFELPGLGKPLPVPVASTDHVLLQHLGRGSALAVIYVLRGGRNADDTPYFQNACLGVEGAPHPRWALVQRYAHAVARHGEALLRSVPVASGVAVAVDGRFDAPAAGVAGHPAQVQVGEASAAFGLCELAGFDPLAVDLEDGFDPRRQRLLVLLNPDVVHVRVARDLTDYVHAGGHVLNLMHLGRHDEAWRPAREPLASGIFAPGGPLSVRRGAFRRRTVELCVPGGPSGTLPTSGYVGSFRPSEAVTVLARLPGRLGLSQGPVVGWTAPVGQGQVTCFGANVAGACASSRYYTEDDEVVERARGLLTWLAERAGCRPAVRCTTAAASCWGRRDPQGGGFLFVAGRHPEPRQVTLELLDPVALFGAGEGPWRVEEVLSARVLHARAGDLRTLDLRLEGYGTAWLRVTRA